MASANVTNSQGVTPSERFLKKLCERSFLSLWSYPNVHRDQSGNKELCDLLVVFEQTAVIFSDKSCAYPDTGNPQLDWDRWYDRAIRRSAKQAYGAERWLRQHPERVFTDRDCTRRLPLDLRRVAKFHRVIVAHGAAQRCRAECGGTGALMLSVPPPEIPAPPPRFVLGRVDPEKPYVHVFDEVTLEVVLSELDTVADFLRYLSAKEALIETGKLGGALGGELDLLGCYLLTRGPDGSPGFPQNEGLLVLEAGFWPFVVRHAAYRARKVADRISYWWDGVIERFAQHVRDGTLEAPSEPGFADHEARLRVLAAEPRFDRRMLSSVCQELFERTPANDTNVRVIQSWRDHRIFYVFALVTPRDHPDYAEYRKFRRWLICAYCLVVKHLNPSATHVVGLAAEPSGNGPGTEELTLLQDRHWTPEVAEMARGLHEDGGLLRTVTRGKSSFNEYQRGWTNSPERTERNRRKKERQKQRSGARRRPK